MKSKLNRINLRDAGEGFLTAVAGALIIFFWQIFANKTPINEPLLMDALYTGLAAGFGYLANTFFRNNQGKLFKKDKEDIV